MMRYVDRRWMDIGVEQLGLEKQRGVYVVALRVLRGVLCGQASFSGEL
jgi:hypothetical protein